MPEDAGQGRMSLSLRDADENALAYARDLVSSYPRLEGEEDGGGTQAQVVSAVEGAGGTAEENQGGQPQTGQGSEEIAQEQSGQPSSEYSLASGFLEDVPEEHLELLEPYVKKWDAGVTRRFQDLHSQYKPYQELGLDVEDLQAAAEIYQSLNQNPQHFFNVLAQSLGVTPQQLQQATGQQGAGPQSGQQQGQHQQGQVPPEFDALDEPFQKALTPIQEQLQRQQQLVQTMAELVLEQRSAEKAATEDQELENYLGLLKDEFGDFDEEYVLTKMYHGASGEDAVKAWKNMIQQRVNESQKPGKEQPTILSGGGAVPADNGDVTQLSNDDVKSLVANLATQANQG